MNEETVQLKGLRLRTVNVLMILLSVLISLLLFLSALQVSRGYGRMQEAVDVYIQSEIDATDLQAGSDYLTEQVRSFAVTGDIVYAKQYFEEAEVTRRRDRALEKLEPILKETSAYSHLERALAYSNELMETEYRAFLLVLEAEKIPRSQWPSSLAGRHLSAEDLALPGTEKEALAVSLVFDEDYQTAKKNIRDGVDTCISELIEYTKEGQDESSRDLQRLLNRQNVLSFLLLLMVFTDSLINLLFVIRPLLDNIRRIQAHEYLREEGLYEMRFLAKEYNSVLAANRTDKEKLSYEATHDGLTGLYNRAAYDRYYPGLENTDICYLMVDVDDFKSVNDTYGHDVGDLVLKKTADVLRNSFRSEDMVFRMGGDEFVVIMMHMHEDLAPLVSRKIEGIGNRMRQAEGNIPAVSVSIGAAFSNMAGTTGRISKDADVALYEVKKTGKGGYQFFRGTSSE